MDPIKSGSKIFKKIAEEFEGKNILGKDNINKFFSILMKETKGLVIVDFLDTTNWDKIESFEFDENGNLTLVWYDYRSIVESEIEAEMRKMVSPGSFYGLTINPNSIKPIITKDTALFLINGYSKTTNQIKKLMKNDSSEFKVFDNSFFAKRVIRKIENDWQDYEFHCTPIFSIAIIPKDLRMSTWVSKYILYKYNVEVALRRITSVISSLEKIDPEDFDRICEKVNTARRVLESVLKIECCYKELEVKGNYSEVLLGQLLNLVKSVNDEDMKPILGKMAELLNEFSHDSGKEVDVNKAKIVCGIVLLYIKIFQLSIKE